MAEAGYSDARVERLLSADDPDIRRQLFARMVRFMTAKAEGFDWAEAAAWLLSGPNTRREKTHRIARDYYRTQLRDAETSAKE
jgi:hypothetical protein